MIYSTWFIGNMWKYNNAEWYTLLLAPFCDIFKVKCSGSSPKTAFIIIQNRQSWLWQCFKLVVHIAAVRNWNVQWVALKGSCCIAFKNKILPTLNPTLILSDRANKIDKNKFLFCAVQCCTGCATEQVYYIRKSIHMELVKWCKCQNLLVYKSCTMVKVFWGHYLVFCARNCMKISRY